MILGITGQSEIFEKHITSHNYRYLIEHHLLRVAQSGYREEHACQTAYITVIGPWIHNLSDDEIIETVSLDLKKACGSLDHHVLLYK